MYSFKTNIPDKAKSNSANYGVFLYCLKPFTDVKHPFQLHLPECGCEKHSHCWAHQGEGVSNPCQTAQLTPPWCLEKQTSLLHAHRPLRWASVFIMC